jgi:hypothetical protein
MATRFPQHVQGEPGTKLQIVNADSRYSPVKLVESTPLGYIHIAAEVRPPSRPGLVVSKWRDKFALVSRLKELAHQLEQLDAVKTVTIFDAVAVPPLERLPYIKEHRDAIHVACFDIVVLVETTSPATAREVQATPIYQALVDALASKAMHMHVIVARNAKRVGDVDKTRNGLFLFNYFVADDANVMLQLWDYLAGWYKVETGLDNSILLVPLQGERSDYLAINNARWDLSLPQFLWRQMPKKSFRTYMLANLAANRVGAMPVLYRIADLPRQRFGPVPSRVIAVGLLALAVGFVRKRLRHVGKGTSS